MPDICERIRAELFEMQDVGYRDFQSKLIPNIPKEKVIGVRTPQLRKFAGQMAKEAQIGQFLDSLPHAYYEEDNLHAAVIEKIKDYESCLAEVERFLPYVDNWATCDMFAPKVFEKHTGELENVIRRWLESGETYTIRFGIDMLMRFYLGEHFRTEQQKWIVRACNDEYYVKMAVAWYFATALAKQYETTVTVLEQGRLDAWTHNKTIQKARESYRITQEQKEYLKSLKRREE